MGLSVAMLVLPGCPGGDDGNASAPPVPQPAVTGSLTFEWDASSDTDLAGYRVYRSTTAGIYGAPVATLSASATRYQAINLQKGVTYYFVVSAYDSNGNESPFSNEVSQVIP
jgi:hypothetical protein